MDLTTAKESGYLRAIGRGEFVLPNAQKQFMDLLDVVIASGAERVLLDVRPVTGTPDIIERYLYGDFIAMASALAPKAGLRHAPKFAYVLHAPLLDPGRLGETVARNRGMSVRAFEDEQEALTWLLSHER
jgi:hypothetical protein